MAKELKVYKGEEVVATAEVTESGATATIPNLTASTEYPEGTYKVAFSNETGESARVDVPAFTTTTPAEPEPEA